MLSQERTVTVGRKRRSKIRKLSHLRWRASIPWAAINILIVEGRDEYMAWLLGVEKGQAT